MSLIFRWQNQIVHCKKNNAVSKEREKKDKDRGKKIFLGPGFAMASCVLGCAVAKATVTW